MSAPRDLPPPAGQARLPDEAGTPASAASSRAHRRWWIAFVVSVVLVAGFSVGVGQYLVMMREPVVAGESGIGEWADLSEYGMRIRIDDVVVTESLPSRFSDGQTVSAPEGMAFFMASFTVEMLASADEDMGCRMTLLNADGEELGQEELAVGHPDATECVLFDSGIDLLQPGDTFESAFVRVVPPAPEDSFELRVRPVYTDDWVYWRFTF